MKRLPLLLLAIPAFAQLGPIANESAPQFRTDLNTALSNAASRTANLSDLSNAGTARTNLGLGTIATQSATTGSAPQKANGSGGLTPAAAADVVGLFTSCSGTQSLGADGACHSAGVSAGTPLQKGDGSGGFSSSSITDNGTSITTTEPFTAKSVTTGDATASGGSCFSGFTAGTVCWVSANTATGTDIAYIMPTTNGTAGQYLKDNGSVTCPTLAAGAPALCHQMAWATISSGGAGTIICSSATASSTTASLTEVNLQTCTIPAGTLTATSRVVVTFFFKYVGTTSTKTPTVRHSSSSGGTAGTLLYNTITPSNLTVSTWNTPMFMNVNSLSVQVAAGGGALGNSNNANVAGAIDTSAASYINFNCQVTNAADNCSVVNYMVIAY